MLEFTFLLLLSKLLHMIVLWTLFYITEKITLDAFVMKMYVDNGDNPDPKPPPLWRIPVSVFAVDLLFVVLISGALLLAVRRLVTNPVIGGQTLLSMVSMDMLICYALCFAVAAILAAVAQNQSCCRYKEDGIRGIRAYTFAALCASLILCIPPYCLLY